MPEDQGVNGDLWNDEAAKLLKALGWEQIGDANVDVVTEEGKKRGIDRIFTFPDYRRNNRMLQTVFVEAKCYNSNNLQLKALQDWVTTLNKKLTKTRNSNKFLESYPMLTDTVIRCGLIVVWFSNAEEFSSYKSQFTEYLKSIRVPGPSRVSQKEANFLYILSNGDILRLASLISVRKEFNRDNDTVLKFYYPPSENFKSAVDRGEVLTLDYMFSKFILAEAVIKDIEHKIVFYFGELSYNAFKRLYSFLLANSFVDKSKPLTIYKYHIDSEFRKIRPEVDKLFKDVTFSIKDMDHLSQLPAFIKNADDK